MPNPARHLIERPRLTSLLDEPFPLTYLIGPPGVGKRSAVLGWAMSSAGRHDVVAWLRLAPEMDNVSVLVRYLEHALASAGLPIEDSQHGRTAPDEFHTSSPGASLLSAIARYDGSVVLVIEGVHHLSNPAVLLGLGTGADSMSDNFRIIQTGRSHSGAVGLARRRIDGRVHDIAASDIAFSLAETTRYLTQHPHGKGLVPHAEALHDLTRGWPVAVSLAAARAARLGDPLLNIELLPSDPDLARYVGDELLRGSSRDANAVVSLAVAGEIAVADADQLVGRGGAAALEAEHQASVIERIEDPDRGPFFRHRRLLRTPVLEAAKELLPDLVNEAAHNVALLHANRGSYEKAFEAASAGSEVETIALLERHGSSLLASGHAQTINNAIRSLSVAAVARRSDLLVQHALSEMYVGDHLVVSGWLDEARSLAEALPEPDRTACLMSADSVTARWACRVGDCVEEVHLIESALAAKSSLPASLRPPIECNRFDLAVALSHVGQSVRALELCDEIVSDATLPIATFVGATALMAFLRGADGLEEANRALIGAKKFDIRGETLHPALFAMIIHGPVGDASRLAGLVDDAAEHYGSLILNAQRHALASIIEARSGRDGTGHLHAAEHVLDPFPRPNAATALLDRAREVQAAHSAGHQDLSDQELRVLRALVGSLTQREIAEELNVSYNTVKTYSRRLYRKLSVASRSDAVSTARELGLLPPG